MDPIIAVAIEKVNKIIVWDEDYEMTGTILNGGSSTSITLENENFMDCPNDGGCSLTGFYFNEEILKTTSWFGFSNGYQEIHYYYQEGVFGLLLQHKGPSLPHKNWS